MTEAEMSSGEIARSFKRVEDAVKELSGEAKTGFAEMNTRIDLMGDKFVHRTEWALHRQAVDEKFVGVEKDISEVKQTAENRRMPWTGVVSVILAAIALAAGFDLIG